MEKGMKELYKNLNEPSVKSKMHEQIHLYECNVKNDFYSAQHQISGSHRTHMLRRLTD